MKKIIVITILCTLLLSACGNNVDSTDITKEQMKESTEQSVETTVPVQTTETQSQVEYTLEDGKYQVSETFNTISEYDEFIYEFFKYSDAEEDGEIDDIDFVIEQINKYKNRTERALLELDNYDKYEGIKECKSSLKKYREVVIKYSDMIINDLPTQNDNKYVMDDYFKYIYPYRDTAKNDVYYVWDAY